MWVSTSALISDYFNCNEKYSAVQWLYSTCLTWHGVTIGMTLGNKQPKHKVLSSTISTCSVQEEYITACKVSSVMYLNIRASSQRDLPTPRPSKRSQIKRKIWNGQKQGCQLQLRQLIKMSMNSFTRELRRSGVAGVAHIKQLLIQLRHCREGRDTAPPWPNTTYLEWATQRCPLSKQLHAIFARCQKRHRLISTHSPLCISRHTTPTCLGTQPDPEKEYGPFPQLDQFLDACH